MKKHTKRLLALLLTTALALSALVGCGGSTEPQNSGSTETDGAAGTEPRVLKVAYRQSDAPMTYQGDDGNPTGALCEIFAIATEYLEGYEFEYIPTSNEDLNLGLASGEYDIGLFNAAYTPDRAATYVFPHEYFGASKMVAVLRNENADADTIEKIVDLGLTSAPVAPSNGMTFALEQWNEYNPDQQIELTYRDDTGTNSTDIADVATGKYGVIFTLEAFYNAWVTAEDGVFHEYADQLTANFVIAMKTYPMLSAVTIGTDEEFIAALDAALLAARNDPRTVEISEKYYGDNFLEYPYGEGW